MVTGNKIGQKALKLIITIVIRTGLWEHVKYEVANFFFLWNIIASAHV